MVEARGYDAERAPFNQREIMKRVSYHHNKPRSSGRILVLVVLAVLVAGGLTLRRQLRLPPPPTITLTSDLPGVGRRTTVTVKVSDPHGGIQRVTVTGQGAGLQRKVLSDVTLGTDPHSASEAQKQAVVNLVLGRETTPELKPGTLTLDVVVQARGTRLRKMPPVTAQQSLSVRFEPPAVAATSQFIHPAQGGAEVVVYEVGPNTKRHGVRAGSWFFPGSPLPGGGPQQRFVIFGAPYDLDVDEAAAKNAIVLVAEDDLGNRNEVAFLHKWFRRPMGRDVIELQDSLMQKVTSEIYGRTPSLARKGTLLADYLQLNGDLRRANMKELLDLARTTEAAFLWSEVFLPMQNAAVKGSFADRRTYTHAGKPVDTQDHLGFDLASNKQAPVQAPNAGRIALARYFGIFGNCVVIDHGYGLMSLSAHLSTIAVKEGERVTRGKEIGRSGATGLAGGDHLHFTMLVHGLPVTPVEWWDGHWIKDRVALKLGPVLKFTGK
ncbi:MAG TPA: M23 family metallopeptidase [Polyangia bacterium]